METIGFGGLELRFLRDKEATGGSLDLFEMTVQPQARMPVAHHHEGWEETIYGLAGVTTWLVDGSEVVVGPGAMPFIPRGVVHGFRNDWAVPAPLPIRTDRDATELRRLARGERDGRISVRLLALANALWHRLVRRAV